MVTSYASSSLVFFFPTKATVLAQYTYTFSWSMWFLLVVFLPFASSVHYSFVSFLYSLPFPFVSLGCHSLSNHICNLLAVYMSCSIFWQPELLERTCVKQASDKFIFNPKDTPLLSASLRISDLVYFLSITVITNMYPFS